MIAQNGNHVEGMFRVLDNQLVEQARVAEARRRALEAQAASGMVIMSAEQASVDTTAIATGTTAGLNWEMGVA